MIGQALVLATRNPHKVREVRRLLADSGIDAQGGRYRRKSRRYVAHIVLAEESIGSWAYVSEKPARRRDKLNQHGDGNHRHSESGRPTDSPRAPQDAQQPCR